MKLTKVIINNFRSFGESQIIELNNQTVLIGNNSSGKTTVLQALSKLFKELGNASGSMLSRLVNSINWTEDEKKEIIDEIISDANGVCLLATHSAIVLQELAHINIRKIVRNFDNNQNRIESISIKTFGESISYINNAIFGTDLRNTGFYKFIVDLIKEDKTELDKIDFIFGSEALLVKKFEEVSDEEN